MKAIKRLLWVVGVLVLVAGIGFWMRPVSYFNEAMYLRECYSGVENHSVQVAGYRVHFLAEGPASGPVVVLVHGLGGRAEDWRALAPYFARAGYRVYSPDLPGYGRSEQPANFSYSVRDEAHVVVGFLDALGLKQVDLGGWSMGGWIVQLIASEHPERVNRLMLYDAAGIYEKPDWDTRLFTPTTPAEIDQLDALLMPKPPKVPGFVARDVLRVSNQNAWVIHRAVATMLTAQDTTDKLLPGLKMPVLIVWGGKDRITPLSQAETMHRLIPQSDLEVFPGCGHLAPGQCAAQVGPKAVEFVKQSVLNCVLAVNLAHAQFAGNWQTPPALATGRPIYSVRILESDSKISGTLIQVFPNGSQQAWPILKPEVKDGTLLFQTQGPDTTFHWRLMPKTNTRRGTLHGVEGPTAAGQRSGEMVIDFPITNRR